MIIEFGDWRLVPSGADNWELAHRHAAKSGKYEGQVRWIRIGRYYQYNTVANAVEYAIDCDMREGKDVATLAEFLAQYRTMIAEFEKAIVELMQEWRNARG